MNHLIAYPARAARSKIYLEVRESQRVKYDARTRAEPDLDTFAARYK